MTTRHNSSKQQFRARNNDILHLCLMKGASQFQSCRLTTHFTTHLTTDVLIHSKTTFVKGIMMFCIAVIFHVSAQLGRLLTSRLSSRLINKSSTKSWLSTTLTKYWHFAPMSETIFRLLQLLRTSDFTSRQQNVNITLYLFHFMQTCCELLRLHEIPLPGPCRKSHCLGPRNFRKHLHFRYHIRIRIAISSTTQRKETGIT